MEQGPAWEALDTGQSRQRWTLYRWEPGAGDGQAPKKYSRQGAGKRLK